MTKTEWAIQAAVWRAVARLVPTCFLQWELQRRPGVDAERLPANMTRTVAGPCVVTVNRD